MYRLFATPAGYDLYDPEAERLSGPPEKLCRLYGPNGAELIFTTAERDDFELATRLNLDSDSPHRRLWQQLFKWLVQNVGVFDVTGNLELRRAERRQRQPLQPEYFI